MFGALNRLGVSVKKALSGNAVGSSEPSLAFNFDTNKYVANGTKNFNQAITHARSGNQLSNIFLLLITRCQQIQWICIGT